MHSHRWESARFMNFAPAAAPRLWSHRVSKLRAWRNSAPEWRSDPDPLRLACDRLGPRTNSAASRGRFEPGSHSGTGIALPTSEPSENP